MTMLITFVTTITFIITMTMSISGFTGISHHLHSTGSRNIMITTNQKQYRFQRNYKHTDDDNENHNGDTSFTIGTNPKHHYHHQQQQQPSPSNNPKQRRVRRPHRSKRPKKNRYRRYLPPPMPLFTFYSMAPSLTPTDITDKVSPPHRRPKRGEVVVSPTVLLQNALECVPSICGPLPVTYTNDERSIARWLEQNVYDDDYGVSGGGGDRYKYVGMDVESCVSWGRNQRQSNPTFSTGSPATIQLSTPTSCLIIHLTSRPSPHNQYPTTCSSPSLRTFLSNPQILKVGVNIDSDALSLHSYNPHLLTNSRLDIGGVGTVCRKRRVGLENLVRATVGMELAKSKRMATSDWSRVPLSRRQRDYAGRDAWAGAMVLGQLVGVGVGGGGVDGDCSLFKGLGCFDLNEIGDGVVERERGVVELEERLRRREWAKRELSAMIQKPSNRAGAAYQHMIFEPLADSGGGKKKMDMSPATRAVAMAVAASIEEEAKAEANRRRTRMKSLRQVVEEMAPDEIPLFHPDEYGLDFSFEALLPCHSTSSPAPSRRGPESTTETTRS